LTMFQIVICLPLKSHDQVVDATSMKDQDNGHS
jgi:hypothetical protein